MWSGVFIQGWVERFHKAGIKILFRPMTPEPNVVKQAIDDGVDAIIVTGFDEGGTVPSKVVGTFAAIPMVVDIVNRKIPVIAAGGITDARTAKVCICSWCRGYLCRYSFFSF